VTKVISYTALLYGCDYLGYAIRSVIDAVDEHWVLYTPVGSHGSRTSVPCPDTRDELYAIASQAAGAKLRWVERDDWFGEGAQRDSIHQYAPDASLIVTVDYDEIMQPGLLEYALQVAVDSDVRRWRLPFRHYFRSFYKCILHDPAFPVRIIKPSAANVELTMDMHGMAVNHLGYAITPEMMRYKWQLHGHKNELRHDVDYFTDIYEANRQYDTHPVGSTYWNPETVDPFAEGWFPEWMKSHPFAKMQVIE
jgi:hypothetical protein